MSLGMKRGTVYLEAHQTAWEAHAKQAMDEIQTALKGLSVDVQHIGSTSVKSIKAKPIIDMVVGITDYEAVLARNRQLETFGIIFRFDERPTQLLYVKGNFAADTRTHHIHVVIKGSKEWRHYLNFRDYLNANPQAAAEYERIKEKLAARYPLDREAYLAGKSEVISKLLREAEAWRRRMCHTDESQSTSQIAEEEII